MQTTVLCTKQDRGLALEVLKIYKELRINATAIGIGTAWRSERIRLDQRIGSSTHLLVIYTEQAARSSWLAFLAGYCLGAEKPLLLYTGFWKKQTPPFLAPFFNLSTFDELRSFLETEKNEWAEIYERREARRELLELGVSSRQESLVESIKEGNIHAVELFLKAGFSPDSTDKRGVPLLCLAAREEHRGIVSFLLEQKADVNKQSQDRGNSALMDAVSKSNYDLSRELVAAGADVNLLSKDGQSALVLSVGKSDIEITRLLLEAGADADLADKLGFSARKYAKLFNNPAMVALFKDLAPEGA